MTWLRPGTNNYDVHSILFYLLQVTIDKGNKGDHKSIYFRTSGNINIFLRSIYPRFNPMQRCYDLSVAK